MKIPLHLTLLSLSLFVVGGCEEPARIESCHLNRGSHRVPTAEAANARGNVPKGKSSMVLQSHGT